MAGRRAYGGSNMAVLLQNEGISSGAIEALLASGASPGFHVSRSMVNFEGAHGNTTEYSLYRQVDLEETGDDDLDECVHQPEKRRRLTADQVQFLERAFEVENKLEPARKIQLAKDLGLQPRQVAIWFQNRRARWKTKQLEKDYAALKSSYNNLSADYENLLKEKDKLNAEVIVLTEQQLLLNEKGRNNSETHKLKDLLMHEQVQKRDPDSTPEVQQSYVPFFVGMQEDIKSANAFDSDSAHHSDDGEKRSRLLEPAGSSNTFEQGHSDLSHAEEDEDAWQLEPASSSNAFEQDHSDLSHAEEDVEEKMYRLPTLDDSSCNYGFPVEDQAFWFWHSY